MGRPKKFNLSYFPLDVGFFDDHKVISIEETAGIKGGYIALRLMAMVYADMGYYLEWPQKFEFSAAKRIGNGVTGASVAEILKLCLKYELFNKQVFEKHAVITSAGIQKRWQMVMTILRRKIEVNDAIWLISSEDTPVSSEETTVPATESTQKEIKLNEKKGNEKKHLSAAGAGTPTKNDFSNGTVETGKRNAGRKIFVPPMIDEVKAYFLEKIGSKDDPRSWPEVKCNMEAGKFIDHYIANGWKQAKKPIVDWQAAVRNWIRNAQEGAFSHSTPGPQVAPIVKPVIEKRMRTLTEQEQDINYLYETYLDGKCGFLNVQPAYYDYLKQNRLISFSEDEITDIKTRSINNLQQLQIPNTEQTLKTMMKKEGLLEFFSKQMKVSGNRYIFSNLK